LDAPLPTETDTPNGLMMLAYWVFVGVWLIVEVIHYYHGQKTQ
jgi:hypothetical protein